MEARARRGIEELASDLTRHRVLLVGSKNPSYQRALEHLSALTEGPLAEETIVKKLERVWRDRIFNAYYERPLLLLAAMRHEVLVEGHKHPLAKGFATVLPDPQEVTRDRLRAALSPDRFSLWVSLTTRRVQTNETSRALAWRWPAFLAGCEGGARPLALVDVGASAGLNLVGDRIRLEWKTTAGAPLPVVSNARVVMRAGFDTHPLDVRYEDDLSWMRACIWPGETDRMARFDAAVAAMVAAYEGEGARPELTALNAALVPGRLEALAARVPAGGVTIVYQTFVRGYLDPERQRAYDRGMKTWLSARPPGSAAWITCEIADGDDAELPARLDAQVRGADGDVRLLPLARCGYHPTVVRVNEAAAEELARALRAGPAIPPPPKSSRSF